jgi:apolipoprotein N-acyltransferase
LIILSALLMTLPLSYPGLYYLSWIALVPFLFSIKNDAPVQGFKKGFLLGYIMFISISFWLYFPLVNFSGLPWIICLLLLAIAFIIPGFFYGLWAWTYILLSKKKSCSAFFLAFSWTGLEYLRYRILPALPFGFAGYTQRGFFPLLQLADVGGVFLLSFTVILINGYFFKLFQQRKLRNIIPLCIILIIILVYSNIRLSEIENGDSQYFEVGLVQTVISPDEKWKLSNLESNIDLLLDRSRQFSDPDLIIWPESSLTFDLIRNEYYRRKLINGLSGLDAHIQAGSLAIIDDRDEIFNSSFLFTPEGRIGNRYNKMRLVPFGEYLPFAGLIEPLTGFSMLSKSSGQEVVLFRLKPLNWRTVICSEILYPELVQQGIKESDFVVNQSNEAWYLSGNLQEQMWTAAVFRAVENRRAVVKAGNFAYSGIIDPSGKVVIRGRPVQEDILEGKVRTNREETIYQHWGDYIGYISLALVLLLLLIKMIKAPF